MTDTKDPTAFEMGNVVGPSDHGEAEAGGSELDDGFDLR
ncbi:uncharacterized protein METZ01_LOCUS452397, partial [marine metagenome]